MAFQLTTNYKTLDSIELKCGNSIIVASATVEPAGVIITLVTREGYDAAVARFDLDGLSAFADKLKQLVTERQAALATERAVKLTMDRHQRTA